jgi:quercetin 2,3-dioxygenase
MCRWVQKKVSSIKNQHLEVQIFSCPYRANLNPEVQFAERMIEQNGDWTLISVPKELNAPLVLRQQIAVFDVNGKSGRAVELP